MRSKPDYATPRWRRGHQAVAALIFLSTTLATQAGNYTSDGAQDNLLDSSHGKFERWEYCYGKPDNASLPVDPRGLVQPGVSRSRAVHFNAYWKECHVNPDAVQEAGHPDTCGGLRERFQRGKELLDTGGPHVGALFAGTDPASLESGFGISTFTAGQFNRLWKVWGMDERPENFDRLITQRYGSALAQDSNPYPLPGENPNQTDGGSGQLPEMFTQLRNDKGQWSGRIGITCHACHTGKAGSAKGKGPGITVGSGSSLADLDLFLRDMLALGYPASLATFANLNRTRGTNNASDINLAFLFPDEEPLKPETIDGLLRSGSTASMDTPAWWNMSHRPAKFVDGAFPMDAPRVDMVFYTPFFGLFGGLGGSISEAGQDWMRENGPPLNTWLDALSAPEYPYPVDKDLAREGARLFHTLDMWGAERNNPVPEPKGNGSCASCHGAYASRYANNQEFLKSPRLKGMAGYIVPKDIIGTDPARVNTNNEAVQQAGAKNFFGYPPTRGTENDCGPQNQKRLRGDRELGYLAPPLHGVWATAPYFHNGSVPNVWEVLKPSARTDIWRRVSKPEPEGLSGQIIMGFDTNLDRAYNREKLGWEYEEISCEWRSFWNPSVTPYINCDPNNQGVTPLAQNMLSDLFSDVILAWNILFPPTITEDQMEDRKIFNTHMYSHGNEGHEFNEVLTDGERRAIIEYLKTL